MKPQIQVHIHPTTVRPTPAHVQVAMAAFMACRNCGADMLRGTQCNNCGAWCR